MDFFDFVDNIEDKEIFFPPLRSETMREKHEQKRVS
jgi:hypothetical protein